MKFNLISLSIAIAVYTLVFGAVRTYEINNAERSSPNFIVENYDLVATKNIETLTPKN